MNDPSPRRPSSRPSRRGDRFRRRAAVALTAAVSAWIGSLPLSAQTGNSIQEVVAGYPDGDPVSFASGEPVELWASETTMLGVVGPLSLASSAEIRTPAGTILPGSAATITDRWPYAPIMAERLVLRVVLNPELTPGGPYQLVVHLPDGSRATHPLRIYETGVVESITQTGGVLRAGLSVDVTFRGRQVGQLGLIPRRPVSSVDVLTSSPTSTTLRLHLTDPWILRIRGTDLRDRAVTSDPNRIRVSRRYDAPETIFAVDPNPTVHDVSPTTVLPGQTVSVLGERLAATDARLPGGPARFEPYLEYPSQDGQSRRLDPVESSNSALRFVLPDRAVSGEYRVVWSADEPPYPDPIERELPTPLTVVHPPRVATVENVTRRTRVLTLPGDELELEGSALAVGESDPIVRIGARQLALAAPPSPDRLRVRVSETIPPGEVFVRVSTTAGTDSVGPVRIPAPPRASSLRMGEWQLPTTGPVSFREVTGDHISVGRRYVIRGSDLAAAEPGDPPTSTLTIGTLVFDGDDFLSVTADSVAFEIPVDAAPASSVEMIYRHAAGSTSLGPFALEPLPGRPEGIALQSDTLTAGSEVEGELRWAPDASPPPDGSIVYLDAPDGFVMVPPRAGVANGRAAFSVRALDVPTPRTVRIRARIDGAVRETEVTVIPPRPARPVGLTLESTRAVGPAPVRASVVLDGPPLPDQTLLVSVDAPDLVDAPGPVSLNGETVEFTLTTRAVEAPRTVSVRASTGDGEATARLRLEPRPVTLADVEVPAERLITPSTFQAVIRMTGWSSARPPTEVALKVSPGLEAPSRVRVESGRTSVDVVAAAVDRPTRVSITASSEFGEATRNFVVLPLEVVDVSLERPTVSPRETVDATIRLSGPAPDGTSVTVVSSDPSVVAAPGTVRVRPGDTVVRVPIQALARSPAEGVEIGIHLGSTPGKVPAATARIVVR